MKNNYLIQEHQKINYQIKLDYNNVCDLLFKKAEENPRKKFLICPGEKHEEFTYSEFETIVNQTSQFLIKSGLKKNNKISLIFHNSSEFLILYFAGLCCGLTIVPINPVMSSREIKYIIEDSDSKTVFYSDTLESKINTIRDSLSNADFQKTKSIKNLISLSDTRKKIECDQTFLHDIAVIIYTSGTTGNPKGVILSHLNLLSDAMGISKWFEFTQDKSKTFC